MRWCQAYDKLSTHIKGANSGATAYLKDAVISAMNVPEIRFQIDLNGGDSSGTAWGCDLTEDYVTLNSAYST